MRIKNFILFALVFYTALSTTGCLRYVPSRSELTSASESKQMNDNTQTAHVEGKEAFAQLQAAQKTRLMQLCNERQVGGALSTDLSYHIHPGDLLSISVVGFPDLSTSERVKSDGTITVPMVGEVQTSGSTDTDLQEKLTSALRKFVRQPQVRLSVAEYGGQKISVLGEVSKPGVYPLKHDANLITDLISEAGGRTTRAGRQIVLIPAPSDNLSHRNDRDGGIEISIDELVGSLSTSPLRVPLRGGDTIIVPEAGTFNVEGEVIKPGVFPLSSKTTTIAAISAAGGLTYSANLLEVEVIRDFGDGHKASQPVNLQQVALGESSDVTLRDGDIVRVPSDPGQFNKRQIGHFFESFFRVGVNRSVQ